MAWLPNAGIVSPANIYYDRPQQPPGLAGFPYIQCIITEDPPDVTTSQAEKLVSYHLEIKAWTAQGQPGSSGDQITDQGNIMRALETVLSQIPPNQPWYFVAGFLHCIEGLSRLAKDDELYLGQDVYVSTSNWDLLIQE